LDSYTRALVSAIRHWVGTQDVQAEVPLTSVSFHTEPETGCAEHVQLYETPSTELIDLLELDMAARLGISPDDRDDHNRVVFAGLRLRHLLSPPSWRRSGKPATQPAEAVESLLLIRDLMARLCDIAEDVVGIVGTELEDGRLIQPPDNNVSSELARLSNDLSVGLQSVDTSLVELARAVNSLQRTAVSRLPPVGSGITPDVNLVVLARLGGWTGRYHVRVYLRGSSPVVILGELTDNGAQVITNGVERLARVVSEYIPAARGDVVWLQYAPAESMSCHRDIEDQFDRVRFKAPDFQSPDWSGMSPEDVAQLIGGAPERWHVSDYTSKALQRRGVRVVDLTSD
jgi:hypothetical protein